MQQTILVVEDEKEIADTLTYALTSENFNPIWVSSCEQATFRFNSDDIDLCVLDVGLPDGNGFELLKSLRSQGFDAPVIFLTARGEEIDRIIGLEIGADDYVCKPFSPREVVARVKVVLKRLDRQSQNHNSSGGHIESGDFENRAEQRQIVYQQSPLELTRAEYELMAAFIARPGQVFSRRQLIERIWSSNHPSDDRAIDTHIKTLRAKLKTCNPHTEFIVTHRGFGYSFDV